jgi:hypothetical protein
MVGHEHGPVCFHRLTERGSVTYACDLFGGHVEIDIVIPQISLRPRHTIANTKGTDARPRFRDPGAHGRRQTCLGWAYRSAALAALKCFLYIFLRSVWHECTSESAAGMGLSTALVLDDQRTALTSLLEALSSAPE